MEYFTVFLCLFSAFCLETRGLPCLEDEACRSDNGQLRGKKVDDVTYCCADSSDHVDMMQVAPGNVTCHCTTTAQAAKAYADRTMKDGLRTCHWGPVCEEVAESLKLEGFNDSFCCLGNNQYLHTRHFGIDNVVCRCQGSLLPPKNPRRYFPPLSGNASTSGENCSYNEACEDSPSTQCRSDMATFCCYGSRGLETLNDPRTNSTRCTCTNDFMGTRCTSKPPFPVEDKSTQSSECKSGVDECKGMESSHTCSHGNALFCCPQKGINLTIVNDVISSCTCITAGRQCNVTFTSPSQGSTFNPSSWCSVVNLIVAFSVPTVLLQIIV